jgi:rubrerythrin
VFEIPSNISDTVFVGRIMADFDAIYEEEEEHEGTLEETYVTLVPDPVVIRGAGNMTV